MRGKGYILGFALEFNQWILRDEGVNNILDVSWVESHFSMTWSDLNKSDSFILNQASLLKTEVPFLTTPYTSILGVPAHRTEHKTFFQAQFQHTKVTFQLFFFFFLILPLLSENPRGQQQCCRG